MTKRLMTKRLMTEKKILTPSLEHYLRTIHELQKEKGYARVTDVAEKLKVAKPAVSNALKKLIANKFVDHKTYESILLTKKGEEQAINVSGKFSILMNFLIEILGINQEKAFLDACLMEHYISPTSLNRFLDLLRFFESKENNELLELFKKYQRDCESDDNCPTCSFHCDVSTNEEYRLV